MARTHAPPSHPRSIRAAASPQRGLTAAAPPREAIVAVLRRGNSRCSLYERACCFRMCESCPSLPDIMGGVGRRSSLVLSRELAPEQGDGAAEAVDRGRVGLAGGSLGGFLGCPVGLAVLALFALLLEGVCVGGLVQRCVVTQSGYHLTGSLPVDLVTHLGEVGNHVCGRDSSSLDDDDEGWFELWYA